MKIATENVAYRDGGTELAGIFFVEEGRTEKRPGVLVVHGGAGLDEHAKGRALRFSEQGYVVFACDMYGAGVAGDRARVMARIAELRGEPGRLVRRAQAGMSVLVGHPLMDGRMGAVGYCFGGMTVLELARSGAELAGVVSVHGSLGTEKAAEIGAIKAKILVCHGALDPHVPMTQVNTFVEEMKRAGADWQLIVYGGAMHGFTHESGPAMPGVAYHALSDARSAAAMKDFFAELFTD
jgi:dienelactone hydrolase